LVLIGLDVGGTFTDIVLYDSATEKLYATKVPTSASGGAERIAGGVATLLRDSGRAGRDVSRLVYGTTLATNVLVEGDGARVGLITTRGFRDVLELGRSDRGTDVYNLFFEKPAPLVKRTLRLEVGERVASDGSVVHDLSDDEARGAVGLIAESGAQAVAVSLVNAFANPEHERRIGDIIAREWPGLHCTLATDVSMEFGELERTSSAVLNAYVMPRIVDHFARVEEELRGVEIQAPLEVIQSNGGILPVAAAARLPIRLVMSGPAAGVTGAVEVGRAAGYSNLITFDMGGTSTDVALIANGQPMYRPEGYVNGQYVRTMMVDVQSIGSGGGSIARLDSSGSLIVGPESAGSEPGPACYGNGGIEPTVTDADLLLGYLNPDDFCGGTQRLDAEAAERAVGALARKRGVDVVQAAQGIVNVAQTHMVTALRRVSTERGADPRDYVLVAYGGAGAVHAAAVAAELKIPTVLVPAQPGVLSARGSLMTELRTDVSRTFVRTLSEVAPSELEAEFDALEEQALNVLRDAGHSIPSYRVDRATEMCYAGQRMKLPVTVEAGRLSHETSDRLARGLDDAFERLYGFLPANRTPQLVNLRLALVAHAAARPLGIGAAVRTVPQQRDVTDRLIHFPPPNGSVACPVVRRESLAPGQLLPGPCIVEEDFATSVVHIGQRAHVDDWGSLVIATQERR
jgi:N-methylhydantoinase A